VSRLVDDGEEVHLVGVGTAGPAALHAAALDGRVRSLTLERSVVSWSAVVRTPISHNQLANVVPGVLAAYDLPELTAAVAPRPLTLRETVDPVGNPASAATVGEAYRPAREAYARHKAEKAFAVVNAGGD
jgi:hypothetical protein